MQKNNSILIKLFHKFESRSLTSLLLLIYLLLSQAYFFKTGGIDIENQFGPEWKNVPLSILNGNGYSNTFDCSSGPTAWMVPGSFLPVILVFSIFGFSKMSFVVLCLIRIVGIVLSFNLFLKSKWFDEKWYNNLIILALFSFYVYLSPNEFFIKIDDFWFYMVFSFLFLYYFSEFLDTSKKLFPLAILSFFIPITTPGMAIPFVAVILVSSTVFLIQLLKKGNIVLAQSTDIRFIHYFILGFAFLLSVTVWTIRNYVVFDKFIPLKSNAPFEFYLSNIADKDGIHSYSTWTKEHPGSDEAQCKELGEKGEQIWLEGYAKKKDLYLNNNKEEYLGKLINRIKNAYLFTINEHDFYESKYFPKLSEEEKNRLIDTGLIKYLKGNYYWWFCLDRDKKNIINILEKIDVMNDDLIADWDKAAKLYRYFRVKDFQSDSGILKGLAFSGFPFLCLILLLFLKITYKKEILYISIFYIIYLIPYILLSHQLRYQKPLIVIQASLIFLLIAKIINNEKKSYIGY